MPFQWGVNDCALFAADVVVALTGADPMAGLRGYGDEAGARAAIQSDSNGLLYGAVCRRVGSGMSAAFARRGDIAFGFWSSRGAALGVVLGAEVAVPGPDGLMFVPRRLARAAWPIGWQGA